MNRRETEAVQSLFELRHGWHASRAVASVRHAPGSANVYAKCACGVEVTISDLELHAESAPTITITVRSQPGSEGDVGRAIVKAIEDYERRGGPTFTRAG